MMFRFLSWAPGVGGIGSNEREEMTAVWEGGAKEQWEGEAGDRWGDGGGVGGGGGDSGTR